MSSNCPWILSQNAVVLKKAQDELTFPWKGQDKVTLGKSDPRWVAPAGCDLEVKATLPQPETLCKMFKAVA